MIELLKNTAEEFKNTGAQKDSFLNAYQAIFIDRNFKINKYPVMKFSVEIGPKTDLETLPNLKDVYITMLPGGDYKETAQQAINLVKKMKGNDPSSIMGLPLIKLIQYLEKFGVKALI